MRITTAVLLAALALSACSRTTPKAAPSDAPTAISSDVEPASTAVATPTTTAVDTDNDPSEAPSTLPVALVPPVAPDADADAVPGPLPTAGVLPASAVAEESFAPRDECSALPGWKPFRERLAAAVKARDGVALAKLADPAVKLDFGGGAGSAELQKRLRAGLWRELAELLPLGCSVDGGIAAMPWYFWRIPPKVDPAEAMLVSGASVVLKAKPLPGARTVTTLDWPIVILADKGFDPASRFTHVRTRAGGLDGYVETGLLRSLLARRVVAEQAKGEWRITAIVAGD